MEPQQAALILQGKSDYNALSGLNHEVALALESLNIKPIVMVLGDNAQSAENLREALQKYGVANILAVFCFSGVGIEVGDNEKEGNFWARLKLPVVNWQLDHPSHMLARNDHASPFTINMYSAPDFYAFQKNTVRSKRVAALNRFGTLNGGRLPQKRELKRGETPLIVFPKSLSDPISFEKDWAGYPPLLRKILHDAADAYWGETARSGPVDAALLKVTEANELYWENDPRYLSLLITQLDLYMRAKKSEILFRALMPYPVRIYSKDADFIDTSNAKASLLNPIDFRAMMDLYHESVAVVSMNPNIDDETHDRVFAAFGCGALPISDVNPWWTKNFSELLPFSYDFRERSPAAAIERVLDDPQGAADLGWRIGERMRSERPFVNSVAHALEIAASVRFGALVLGTA